MYLDLVKLQLFTKKYIYMRQVTTSGMPCPSSSVKMAILVRLSHQYYLEYAVNYLNYFNPILHGLIKKRQCLQISTLPGQRLYVEQYKTRETIFSSQSNLVFRRSLEAGETVYINILRDVRDITSIFIILFLSYIAACAIWT